MPDVAGDQPRPRAYARRVSAEELPFSLEVFNRGVIVSSYFADGIGQLASLVEDMNPNRVIS
jgi:hypothetical protein